MYRSIVLILSGNVASAALMMGRTLLVSRLISLEDFGIASIFLLALAMIDMISALGFQQQMAQSNNGGTTRFQSALQGFSVIRGLFNAILMLAIANPIVSFFGVPHTLWAFQLIAVLPLISSFAHFDAQRFGRQMEFKPSVMLILLPPVGSLLAVYPLFHLLGDYRVLVYAILVQATLSIVVSHLVAKRRYRISFDGSVMLQALRFGWPLMASGVLMFFVFYGERGIIARHFGLEMLALFSMALSLTLTPALVVSRSTMSFFLPQLSAARETSRYSDLAIAVLQAHILLGCGMVASIALFGGPFLVAVLGDKYAAATPLLVWLAMLHAFRVFEGGCAIVALAAGHTKNEIMANIVRVSLLPVAWFIVKEGGGVITLLWIGILGEAAGFAIGLALALGKQGLLLRPLLLPLAIAMLIFATSCMMKIDQNFFAAAALFLALLGMLALTMSDLLTYLRKNTATGFALET